MIKKILVGLAVVLAVFLVAVAFKPSHFSITRSTAIPASAAAVFGQVNDLHKWQAWSPWEKLDPAMKRTFEGPAAGVGAAYAWDGNKDVGAGRMTIIESRPAELIHLDLEFIKPMAGRCLTEFTFKPESGQTVVTWTMSGENNYLAKVVCTFMNMDKTVGAEFERGLAELKKVASSAP
ncbi:MAG: hypothetical protein JWM88_816 [Verrucomicrobia bacterium]|nr:hypothetical protein [Verrucomicrobiota bacterium]